MGRVALVLRVAAIGACLCLSTLGVGAASKFVNSTAVGANDGSSFANGWTSWAAINWGSVNPGDTIYVSGGPTASSKTYGGTFTIGKSGTSGNPITIAVKADDASHNGTVIMDGNYIEMSAMQFINITGNVGGTAKFRIQNFFNTSVAEWANAIMAPQSINCSFTYLTISNCNNNINLNQGANWRIANCDMWQTRGDCGMRVNGTYSAGYDGNIIENNILEVASSTVPGPTQGMGPDGIQTGNNITIRNNSFRVKQYNIVTSVQHTDMIQAPGRFLAIYNNDFINVGDSAIQLHGWYAGSAHSDVKIYNNIFRIVDAIDPFPQYIRLYNVGWPITDISNLIIANNLFLDNSWQNIETDIKSVGGNPTGSGNMLVNNIFSNGSGGTGTLFWNLEMSSNFSPGAWTINGNSYYQGGNLVRFNGAQQTATAWVAANEPAGRIGQPLWASYTYRTLGNNLHLSGSDTIARNTAITVGSVVGLDRDKDGIARVAPWDKGPYEYPTSGGSAVIDMASSTYSVSEATPSIAITVRRSGTLTAASGCSYTTANGTASDGVNYTLTSGTLSWISGDGTDKTITVPILNTSMLDTKTFTVTISSPTGGAALGQTVSTVTITGAGTPGTPLLSGWSWAANTGEIAAPFITSGAEVYQASLDNNNPADGGRASYTFTNSAGQFMVDVEWDAPNTGANSVFLDMNSEPTTPQAIWDILPLTSGFESRRASWRGNTGTPDTPEITPKIWTLAGGTNTLIIRGREPNTKFRLVTLTPVVEEPPDPADPTPPTLISIASTKPHGYYRAGEVINLTVTWSTNAVVTGTPRILLDTGGYANYVSGSGTTAHVYSHTVAAGQNSAALDNASTSALELNGGTIKNSTADAVLTCPAPGAAGSLSQSVVLVIDTLKPTLTVSAATRGAAITWQVNYVDINFLGTTIATSNIALVTTGTVTGTPFVAGGALGIATLGVTNVAGAGTLRFAIAAGTGIDLAGNVSDASTTSTESVVAATTVTSTFASGYYRTNVVIPITVNWSAAATVTGTPRLVLNSGGLANYASGSGSTALLFSYIIGTGENTQLLEASSIDLNGGTIRNGGNDVILGLPAAGATGALSRSKTLRVDTTKPVITVGVPASGTTITFPVTYSDLNMLSQTLSTPDLSPTLTGTLDCDVTAHGITSTTADIVADTITGSGTIQVAIAAGTGVDLAGNLADAAMTPLLDVESEVMIVFRSGTIRSATLSRRP